MKKISIEGMLVTKEYYATEKPAISHGNFKIRNNTEKDLHLTGIEVKVLSKEEQINVPLFYLYRLPDYSEIDSNDFKVNKQEELTVDVSFPFIFKYANPFNEIKVGLYFKINATQFSAFSVVKIIIRSQS
ncbi:MAG: hypothetical protein ABJB05_02670 [Parafilimonas sp.]